MMDVVQYGLWPEMRRTFRRAFFLPWRGFLASGRLLGLNRMLDAPEG